MQYFHIPLRNTYVMVMCDHVTWSTWYCGFSVFYERFRKVCSQCNVVHAMECNRSMRLKKVCPQCNTIVHVKRSVCVFVTVAIKTSLLNNYIISYSINTIPTRATL